jgi:hypothetical protein
VEEFYPQRILSGTSFILYIELTPLDFGKIRVLPKQLD